MTRYRDAGLFLSLVVMWGLSYSAIEFGLRSFPPLLLSSLEFGLAGLILLGYAMAVTDSWRPATLADAVAIASGSVFYFLFGYGVWTVGQSLTTSAFSGVMVSLLPITTAAISWVLLPEDRLSPRSLFGLLVAFAGAIAFLVPESGTLVSDGTIGKLLLFSAVCGIALGSVLIRRVRPPLPTAAVTAWSMVIGSALVFALSRALGEAWPGTPTPVSLFAIGYLVVFGSLIANVIFFALLTRHSAIELNLVSYLSPFVSVTAGWLAFGDPITPSMVGGFALVLVGFALMKTEAIRAELLDDHAGG